MNELQVIESREVLGKEFKIYGTIEEPLFLAKDVATWIEHSNVSMMLNKVDDDEKVINNVYTLGGNQEMWFLTEDGLYEVLMQSRKPIAKAFKKQVKQILKALRLNQIELIAKNATDENKIDNLITTANNLIETANGLLQYAISIQNFPNNSESESKKMEVKEKFDTIESEITNLENEFLTVQEFCRFLNSKSVIPKKLGCQTLYQLLRDNNIINYYNTPIKNEYFNIIDNKMYLNKQGMIFIYNLAKENINVNYVVRHK